MNIRSSAIDGELEVWCRERGYALAPTSRVIRYPATGDPRVLGVRMPRPRRRRSGAKAFKPDVYGGGAA